MRALARVAWLFVVYGVLGFGGDRTAGLLAQNPVAVRVKVQVEPEVVDGAGVRNDGHCSFEVHREVSVPLAGASLLGIDAGAGSLRVEGREGLDEVIAVGRACAAREEFIDELRLTIDRVGDEIRLLAHYPDRQGWRGANGAATIDLTVAVPMGMSVDIDDSSGGMEVLGVGDVRIDDSSGSIYVQDAGGSVLIEDGSGGIELVGVGRDVDIEDGSGGIAVRDVAGTVTVTDGSGEIDIAQVREDVLIRADGSGSIRVQDVAGNLAVGRDGSGGLSYANVGGTIDVPEDQRRRVRSN